MRGSIIHIVVLLFVLSPVYSQVENQQAPPIGVPQFYLEALSFLDADSVSSRLDVFVKIPFDMLHFVLADTSYAAQYEVSVNLFDQDDNVVSGKTWDEKAQTHAFDETNARTAYSLTQRSFVVAPGSYTLRATILDEESQKSFSLKREITVADYRHSSFSLSDIMLVNHLTRSGGKTSLVPNVSSALSDAPGKFFLFFETYNKTNADSAKITVRILDEKDQQVFARTDVRSIHGRTNQVIEEIDGKNFVIGNYVALVHAEAYSQGKNGVEYSAGDRKTFSVRWEGVPANLKDLDLAIRELRYIATSKEMGLFEDAKTLEEKQKLFIEFWRKRDPSPDAEVNEYMQQYYARVDYANEHFTHYLEGWKSDRGMVYILLGPPNSVDRHPFETDSKPYEIWSYDSIDRQIVFVDDSGFGNYKLVTPIWDLIHRDN
jgi:GWxTD domain-containing protein